METLFTGMGVQNLKIPLLFRLLSTMSSAMKASSMLLRLGYRRRPAAPAAAFFASLSGHQEDVSAPRRLGFLLPNRPLSSGSNNSSNSNSSTSSSGSSGGSSNDDKTVSEVKAEVEKMSQESTSSKDQWGNRGKLIYEGSISHQVRGLKRVSITTCLISILGVPALYLYGKEGVPMAGQVAVMGTALAGTGCSTLLLNLCVSPYVFRMAEILGSEDGSEVEGQKKMRNKKNRYGMPKISGRRFRVERMNIFGVRSTTEFSIDEVEPMPKTSRPFVSFKANNKHYYIQGHDMEDKVLLKTLLGRDLKDHEK